MLITNIEAQVRTRTWVDTNQYSQAQFLLDINEAKDEFWTVIATKLANMRNYEEWATDTTLLSEYGIPTVASDTAWAKIIDEVSINYTWDTYTETWLPIYKKAREVSIHTLPYEWNYYVENQSINDPIYHISDDSIFIAPTFRTAWLSDRIKLKWIRKIPDYTISTTEAQMRLPVDFQRLLIWAVIPFALMAKRVDDWQVIKAQNDYEAKKLQAIQNLSMRREWPTTFEYPNSNTNNDILWIE